MKIEKVINEAFIGKDWVLVIVDYRWNEEVGIVKAIVDQETFKKEGKKVLRTVKADADIVKLSKLEVELHGIPQPRNIPKGLLKIIQRRSNMMTDSSHIKADSFVLVNY